jgi:hypothetical protein
MTRISDCASYLRRCRTIPRRQSAATPKNLRAGRLQGHRSSHGRTGQKTARSVQWAPRRARRRNVCYVAGRNYDQLVLPGWPGSRYRRRTTGHKKPLFDNGQTAATARPTTRSTGTWPTVTSRLSRDPARLSPNTTTWPAATTCNGRSLPHPAPDTTTYGSAVTRPFTRSSHRSYDTTSPGTATTLLIRSCAPSTETTTTSLRDGSPNQYPGLNTSTRSLLCNVDSIDVPCTTNCSTTSIRRPVPTTNVKAAATTHARTVRNAAARPALSPSRTPTRHRRSGSGDITRTVPNAAHPTTISSRVAPERRMRDNEQGSVTE